MAIVRNALKFKNLVIIITLMFPLLMLAEEKKLEVTISSEKNVYTVDENIKVVITLENVSSQFVAIELPAIFHPQDHYVEFIILDSNGKKVKFSGRELKALWISKTITLITEYKYSSAFNLRKYFKLNKGKYKFSVVYDTTPSKIYDIKVDILRVVSNTFEFEIK